MRRASIRLGTLAAVLAAMTAGCNGSSDSGLKKGKSINKMAYPVSVAPLSLAQVKPPPSRLGSTSGSRL